MTDKLVEQVARAIHEHLCRRDIMQYLDNDEDCAGLAQAALAAARPAHFAEAAGIVEQHECGCYLVCECDYREGIAQAIRAAGEGAK